MLLDTHVVLWLVDDDAHALVADQAKERFEAARHRYISAASAYEIAYKTRQGRLPGGHAVLDGWPRVLRNLRATELALSAAHMTRAGLLDWDHRDPFDRMIVAQSQLENLDLLTIDTHIQRFDNVRTVWTD